MKINNKKYANVSAETITEILRKRKISMYHRRAFLKLTNYGKITSRSFSDRLHHCRNYKAAVKDVMILLSCTR
jgi:hypothetical protein